MIHALLLGLAYGWGLAFLPGPAFFKLILTGLKKGFQAGMYLALGIVLSDLFYCTSVYFGISAIIDTPAMRFWLGAGGGGILVVFGISALFKRVGNRNAVEDQEELLLNKPTEFWKQLTKGFSINTLNPAALFFWIATVTAAHQDPLMKSSYHHWVFFVAILGSVFGTDLLKTGLAQRLSPLLTPRLLQWLQWLIGVVLVLFGAKLLIETVFKRDVIEVLIG